MSTCPSCGAIFRVELDGACYDCRELAVLGREEVGRRAGIPAECRRGAYVETAESAAARAWTGSPQALVISGVCGAGKSRLAAEVLSDWLMRRRPGYFVRASQIAAHARDWRQSLRELPVLVVDDLGHGHPSEWQWAEVADVVVTRWDAGLATIYTTRLDLEMIAERDASTWDRLTAATHIRLASGSRR